jgi:hypothetical protein
MAHFNLLCSTLFKTRTVINSSGRRQGREVGEGFTRIPHITQTAYLFTMIFVLQQEHDSILHKHIHPYNINFATTL